MFTELGSNEGIDIKTASEMLSLTTDALNHIDQARHHSPTAEIPGATDKVVDIGIVSTPHVEYLKEGVALLDYIHDHSTTNPDDHSKLHITEEEAAEINLTIECLNRRILSDESTTSQNPQIRIQGNTRHDMIGFVNSLCARALEFEPIESE